jgi:hypothetical protein
MGIKHARELICRFLIDHNGTATYSSILAFAKDAGASAKNMAPALNNGIYDLKYRGCIQRGSVRGEWEITDAGRAFVETGILPSPQPSTPQPLVVPARKGKVVFYVKTSRNVQVTVLDDAVGWAITVQEIHPNV